jgi:hypothetical protein
MCTLQQVEGEWGLIEGVEATWGPDGGQEWPKGDTFLVDLGQPVQSRRSLTVWPHQECTIDLIWLVPDMVDALTEWAEVQPKSA